MLLVVRSVGSATDTVGSVCVPMGFNNTFSSILFPLYALPLRETVCIVLSLKAGVDLRSGTINCSIQSVYAL